MERGILHRLNHIKNILLMLLGKESLYYGEYAAKTNVSMSYASNLFRIVALKFGLPHRYGVIDNPSDDMIREAIKQIEKEIKELQKQDKRHQK